MMEARQKKKAFSPKAGKTQGQKRKQAKASASTREAGEQEAKPGGKRPFKAQTKEKGKTFEKTSGKGGAQKFLRKKQTDGKLPQKRKFPPGKRKQGEGSEAKKPKWDEFKQKKKELKQNRQQNERKDSYQVIIRAKQIWEMVRRKDCSKEKRCKLMSELQQLVNGKIKTIAFAHDSTRVLQCYIQFGSDEQRQEVFEELKDHMVELSKSKYARNIVKKFLMYGSKQQVAEVMRAFKGQVRQLLRHAEASSVVEYAYNDKAILSQRLMLTEELYGNTFQICKSTVCPTLEKVLEANPEKLNSIMDEMKQILTPMAQKEAVIKHSLVHKVFLDFFLYAPAKLRSEMIESIREAVVYLAHTHDGARVTMHCLWHGTPKDRKVIVKTLKTYIDKFAMGEYAHLVLLAAFDCIDDTKLVKQTILAEIITSLSDVISNKYGKKVLLYLLSPRDPAHFLPEIIQVLEKGDGNVHSKKDTAIRRRELLEAVSPPLLQYLCDHTRSMVMDKARCVAVSDILGGAVGDLQPAMEAVAELAKEDLVPGGVEGQLHVAEHPAGHLVLKWLIEQDAKLEEAGRKERFSSVLLEQVGLDKLKTWVSVNRGTIVLCCLLQSTQKSVAKAVKDALMPMVPELRKMKPTSKGVEVLLEKLSQ
ncbi:pumilio homolog 3 isoform X2 [Brienomyrus brachyistius]|nr:pumilio homolog 3 isoform X2 [Brienomyrus brachyistius]XP_048876033.1 pumilio homolog 3 isoform X2 [Brienomyrus brachyistius]XP_048876034.1 pumilio homolog 3 isoform X2 [Brienomyrus brachyistius]XP_048876035.1 pumilio homolog 3 isoform X2 [Brienomyrus brachyistius]